MSDLVKVQVKPGFDHYKTEDGTVVHYKDGDFLFLSEEELKVIGWKFRKVSEEEKEVVSYASFQEEEKYISIDRLNLNNPMKAKLKAAGIVTVADLLEKDKEDLLKIKGIGSKNLEYILEDARSATA